MVNLTHQELKETQVAELPNASISALRKMREDACASTSSSNFKLQAQQRFLRRVLSPDAPTQNLLMAHGTGTGKTCTAIQIAEEYILRPEFQSKKVLVIANPSVQDNFKNQIFDISRVNVDADGLLLSKQCTGRRYLEILQRAQAQPLKWTDQNSRQKLVRQASRILNEFYDFQGYAKFGNLLNENKDEEGTYSEKWIHDTFDNRLIIVDEAHNLRDTSETDADAKIVSAALERIVKTAHGVTLVLLTATPMFDTFEEILHYFNLFEWNSRRQEPNSSLKSKDMFTGDGEFVNAAARANFHNLCQRYVSYVRGDNPFTFPFRLSPPRNMIAIKNRTHDVFGKKIVEKLKYLELTQSVMSDYQESVVSKLTPSSLSEPRTVCVYPGNQEFNQVISKEGGQFRYANEPFLAPSQVANYSAKFATIINCIRESKGIAFVYSNMVESGARLFGMCLEEHGFKPHFGEDLFVETSGEVPRGSNGTYALFTSNTQPSDIKNTLATLRSQDNKNGDIVRVIVASPKVSEGVDFRYVRQIHILDPWFNMSRIEQVIGRGMRTCSHSLLPMEEQNCTVYLHICRSKTGTREMLDEFIYRRYVEDKAIKIAKVKKAIMESAMDCGLERPVNSLPLSWFELPIEIDDASKLNNESFFVQMRSQGPPQPESKTLKALQAPIFISDFELQCGTQTESVDDPDHERPLSAILDVKDEILDKVIELFKKKPIWKQGDLLAVMKKYDSKLVKYILQNAIAMGFKLKDSNGRIGHLEAKSGVFAFAIGPKDTMVDRLIPGMEDQHVSLPEIEPEPEPEAEAEPEEKEVLDVGKLVDDYKKWPEFAKTFSKEVRQWYYVDHLMSAKDRITHIIDVLNESLYEAPRYASPLIVEVSDDEYFYAIGDKFYNNEYEEFVPIGDQKDAYDRWMKQKKQKFIQARNDYFVAMERNDEKQTRNIVMNVDHTELPLKKSTPTKTLSGRMCTTYKAEFMQRFVEYLGQAEPPGLQKEPRCMFLALVARKAVLEGREGLVWWTPEEWEMLNEKKNSEQIRKELKSNK